MTLSGLVGSADAETCPPVAAEIVADYRDWLDEVSSAMTRDAFSVLRGFQAECDRLGRALLDQDTGNRMLARYSDILAEIDLRQGVEAGSRTFEEIHRAIRRAGNSMVSASECLALVPVDVSDAFSVSLAGAYVVMRYVDAEMMLATDRIDAALRSDAPFTDREGQEFFFALSQIGRFTDISGGIFTECRNVILEAQTIGIRGLGQEWSTATIGNASDACEPAHSSGTP
jgi:hypothetical protein